MCARHIMRFYCKIPEKTSKVRITGDEARHMKVFRLKKGDQIVLFDGLGNEAKGVIQEINKEKVLISIVQREKVSSRPYFVTLATAVPKGKRLDWLIQKAVELGVNKIVQIVSSRSIVKPKSKQRAEKIAIEACKQSGRSLVPEITESKSIDDINTKEYDLRFVGDPEEKKTLKQALKGKKFKKIICLIGPEGGFTDEENEVIKKKGFVAVNLGKEILRTETAGIYMLSAIKYEIDNR